MKVNENQWISMKFWNRYSNFKFLIQVVFDWINFRTLNWNIQVNIWYFYLTVTEIFLRQCHFEKLNLQLLLLSPSLVVFVLHVRLLPVRFGQDNNPCPWYKTGRKMDEFDNSEELFEIQYFERRIQGLIMTDSRLWSTFHHRCGQWLVSNAWLDSEIQTF